MAKSPPIQASMLAHHKAASSAHVRWAGVKLRAVRDMGRQACYDWENKHLRPEAKKLDRKGAKGLARVAAKKAIALMREQGLIRDDADAEYVRASFKVAFTDEHHGQCWGSAGAVYFANWGWTVPIILHEMAHWADQWAHLLAARNAGQTVTDFWGHGPRWRGWFLWMLANVEWAGHSYDLEQLKATMPGSIILPNSFHKGN